MNFTPMQEAVGRRVAQMLRMNPLAMLASCAVLGVLVADRESADQVWWWLVGALLVTTATLRRPNTWMLAAATGLTFGFIHLACLSSARDHPLRAYLKPTERVTATLHGNFVRGPMIRDDSPGLKQARFRVEAIDLPTRGRRFVGAAEVKVWVTDREFVPQGGAYRLEGTLSLVQRSWNPSTFDPEITALNQGVIAEFYPRKTELVKSSFSPRLTLLRWAEMSRQWISEQLSHGIENEEMPRTLITTMALGTSEVKSTELQEPFRRSGTLHVFAVSGLHVALLATIGWLLLRPLGVGRLRAIVILAPSMFVYAYITGWVPSAARAALMSSLMLMAPVFCRDSRTLNSLGAAALLLLASGTLQMFQPGFQLSFVVLGAIAIGARPLAQPFRKWTELDPFIPPRVATPMQRFWPWARSWLVTTLATSGSATLGSLPFMMSHFHSCTPIAVISNAVLVPLSEGSLFLVTLSLIAGASGLHLIQIWLNNANWLVAHAMMGSATFFASIPGGNFEVAPPSFKEQPLAKFDVLSMPTGEGAQVLMSKDQSWMFDVGSARSFKRAINPLLRYEQVTALTGAVISHGDSGHVGGLMPLAEAHPKMTAFATVHEPSRFDAHTTAMWQASLQLDDMGRSFQHLVEGDRLDIGNAQVHILYPGPDDSHGKADDRAMVARIDCGKTRILWCSSSGFLTEKLLLERLPAEELRADVIVRNNHATDLSSLPEFLRVVAPACLVSSYSPPAGERAVSARLREDCERLGIQLFDQSKTGFVRVNVYEDHLILEPWLQGDPLRIEAN